MRTENWRAKDFSVRDGAGQELARVTKRWAGLRELFTDADTYVVEVQPTTAEPLRSLAVASCLVIDVVMKQKGLQLSSAGRREELQGDVCLLYTSDAADE